MWIRCENALSCCSWALVRTPPLLLGSTGCQPVAVGRWSTARLPLAVRLPPHFSRQAAANYRLAACAPQQAESASLFGSPNISRDDGSESTISPGYVVSSHDTATTCGYRPERGDACQRRHKAGCSAYAEICIEICRHCKIGRGSRIERRRGRAGHPQAGEATPGFN